jgi:cytidyltransferase-like protein
MLLLWPDELVRASKGAEPKMGLEERRYYFESLRYVERVESVPTGFEPDSLGSVVSARADGAIWAVSAAIGGLKEAPNAAKRAWCRERGIELREFSASDLSGFPYAASPLTTRVTSGMKRVIVTGCYDWLHTGHLRFFEEAAEYGELNVVIGSDANVRLLKGEGHPLFSQEERSFVVGSFKPVARCLVASGSGWLDAEPEIKALGAARYIVNEDGDKPEKKSYCEKAGIEYIVLKRIPKAGLPRRSSTDLRGY